MVEWEGDIWLGGGGPRLYQPKHVPSKNVCVDSDASEGSFIFSPRGAFFVYYFELGHIGHGALLLLLVLMLLGRVPECHQLR